MHPGIVIIALWFGWLASWLLSALWSNRTEGRLSLPATAAAKGTLLGGAGFLSLLIGVWMKARLGERWLMQELEQGAYADYRKRVPVLIPFGQT